jgi:hypothetical protein
VKIVGIMPARNESWVIAYSARAALEWIDYLILLDHASTDATPGMLVAVFADYPGRVEVLKEPDPMWTEMAQRQRMLTAAREVGATHVAIIDADEVLSANIYLVALKTAAKLRPGEVLMVPWHNAWRSCDRYRCDDSKHARQWLSLVFCDRQDLYWGGAERFHHRAPFNSSPGPKVPGDRHDGGVMHLQRASWRRALARQAWYKCVERLRWPDKPVDEINRPYSESLDEHGLSTRPVPAEWWPSGLDRSMINIDAEPWQELEVRRMVAEHGRERFSGLDLFGVA